MKRPIKNGLLMDVLLCRRFFPAKRRTLRWAKRRVNKDERRAAADELTRMRYEEGL